MLHSYSHKISKSLLYYLNSLEKYTFTQNKINSKVTLIEIASLQIIIKRHILKKNIANSTVGPIHAKFVKLLENDSSVDLGC